MRITGSKLRRIIREELLREAGFGDLRVAEHELDLEKYRKAESTMENLWFVAIDENYKDPATAEHLYIPEFAEYLRKYVDTRSFYDELDQAKSDMMKYLSGVLESIKLSWNLDPRQEAQIRKAFAAWVDHMVKLATYLNEMDSIKGEYVMYSDWRGPQGLDAMLDQAKLKPSGRESYPGAMVDVPLPLSQVIEHVFKDSVETLTGILFKPWRAGLP
jgi:hypothetical protein